MEEGNAAQQCEVSTAAELLRAASDAEMRDIAVAAELAGLPTFRLSPGQSSVDTLRITDRYAAAGGGFEQI